MPHICPTLATKEKITRHETLESYFPFLLAKAYGIGIAFDLYQEFKFIVLVVIPIVCVAFEVS